MKHTFLQNLEEYVDRRPPVAVPEAPIFQPERRPQDLDSAAQDVRQRHRRRVRMSREEEGAQSLRGGLSEQGKLLPEAVAVRLATHIRLLMLGEGLGDELEEDLEDGRRQLSVVLQCFLFHDLDGLERRRMNLIKNIQA